MSTPPCALPGLSLTPIVLGVMGYGGTRDEGAEVARIHAALEAGIGAIDTAPLYDWGGSERVVARALRELGDAPRPIVMTKVGLRWDGDHGDVLFTTSAEGAPRVVRMDSRPLSVRREVLQSLERLGLERIDLVQVHFRDARVPVAETMSALADLVAERNVGAVGVCNFDADDVREAARALAPLPLTSLQTDYSLLSRGVEEGPLPAAREVGAGFLAYSPLAQGLLTGAHGPTRAYPPGDWRASTPLFSKKNRALVHRCISEVVVPIARAHGATPGQVAIAWLLGRPCVSAAIVGASTPAQARENARAASIDLSPGERDSIERAFAALPLEREPRTLRSALRSVRRRLGKLVGR